MAENDLINNETEMPPSAEDSGINAPGNNTEGSGPDDTVSDEEKDGENGAKKNIDWTTIALILIVIVNFAIYLHSVNRSEDSREDEQLAGEPPAQTASVSTSAPSPVSSGQGKADASKPAPGSGDKNAAPGSGNKNAAPGSGNKNVPPGSGNVNAVPGSGNKNAVPGSGDDSVPEGSGNVNAAPGSGNKNAAPGSGDDSVPEGSGNKKVAPKSGNINAVPGSGNDNVLPGSGNDSVPTGSGNDNVPPKSGNDNVVPGSGNDSVPTGSGNDNVPTGSGDNSVLPGSFESNTIDSLLSQHAPGPDPAPLGGANSNPGGTFPHPNDLASMLSTAKGQQALAALQKEKGAIKLTDDQKKRIDKVIASQKKYRELGAGVVAITAILNKKQLEYLRDNKSKLTDARLRRGNPMAKALAIIKPKASSGVPRAALRPSAAPEFNPDTIAVGIILLEQGNLALDKNQAASIAKYLEVMDQINSSIEENLDDIINRKQRAYLEAELNMREKGSNAHL